MPGRLLEDAGVGFAKGVLKLLHDVLLFRNFQTEETPQRVEQEAFERDDGQDAGPVAGLIPADPIGHNEDVSAMAAELDVRLGQAGGMDFQRPPEFRDEETVFVGGPDLAAVGHAEGVNVKPASGRQRSLVKRRWRAHCKPPCPLMAVMDGILDPSRFPIILLELDRGLARIACRLGHRRETVAVRAGRQSIWSEGDSCHGFGSLPICTWATAISFGIACGHFYPRKKRSWPSAFRTGVGAVSTETVRRHDDALLEAINDSVGERDTLWVLGDFCWGRLESAQPYRERIRCRNVHLVWGNHDHHSIRPLFGEALEQGMIAVAGQEIWLNHYPMRSWNKSFHGSWHFYGHVHDRLAAEDASHSSWLTKDVGVDACGYRPWSFEETANLHGPAG